MAKFSYDFTSVDLADGRSGSTGAEFSADTEGSGLLSVDDVLECLRPAALALRDAYKNTISRLFKVRTRALVDSIDIEDGYTKSGYAYITVKPFGTRKKGTRMHRSRAGSVDAKYAKHNRHVSASKLTNAELGYLLEFGTPRIAATHWMEKTNEEMDDTIQGMIEDEVTKLLQKKGLIK